MGRETLSPEFGRLSYVAYDFYSSLTIRSLDRYTSHPQDEILKRPPPPPPRPLSRVKFMRSSARAAFRVILESGAQTSPNEAHARCAILTRPCFCDGEDPWGKGIWPAPHHHDFWPAAKPASSCVEPLAPSLR